eukprot:CAMPEP_0178934694 /NCGR_PEP_ID=MMETSP0786-20121207/24029_1 /TAXON_ID=186022 /ORGANISM="Thalassionema frauenfeldii, Strain CCMP 1798" /LENGTH=68 /DNA_ID=CAMNT_0020612553 /DNA_START=1039 /DNA_END=1245 /DNA_ORIENTATION=-
MTDPLMLIGTSYFLLACTPQRLSVPPMFRQCGQSSLGYLSEKEPDHTPSRLAMKLRERGDFKYPWAST